MTLKDVLRDFININFDDADEPDRSVCKRVQKAICNYELVIDIAGNTSLYIRDKEFGGGIHRIGTDTHDMLYINNDNELIYQNLQNGDGAKTGENRIHYGYEFVPNVNDYGYNYNPMEEEV